MHPTQTLLVLILTFFIIDYSWSSARAYSFQVKRRRSRIDGCINETDCRLQRCVHFILFLDNHETRLVFTLEISQLGHLHFYNAYHCPKYRNNYKECKIARHVMNIYTNNKLVMDLYMIYLKRSFSIKQPSNFFPASQKCLSFSWLCRKPKKGDFLVSLTLVERVYLRAQT